MPTICYNAAHYTRVRVKVEALTLVKILRGSRLLLLLPLPPTSCLAEQTIKLAPHTHPRKRTNASTVSRLATPPYPRQRTNSETTGGEGVGSAAPMDVSAGGVPQGGGVGGLDRSTARGPVDQKRLLIASMSPEDLVRPKVKLKFTFELP